MTVPAASSATVTVTVNPRAEFTSFATKQTPNGTFVEGAVTFTSADGQPDLTVPYLALRRGYQHANLRQPRVR